MLVRLDFHGEERVKRRVRPNSGAGQNMPKPSRSLARTPLLSNWRIAWLVATGLTTVFGLWVIYRWVARPSWLTNANNTVIEFLDLYELGSVITLVVLWTILTRRFWKRRQTAPMGALSRNEMYALSPSDFEAYVGHLFRRKGYTVKERGKSGDQGVDLEITGALGKRAVVQCKRYHKTVSPTVVRELYGTMLHERVGQGFLITTADISRSAREWARGKPLTLIDGVMLEEIAQSLDAE